MDAASERALCRFLLDHSSDPIVVLSTDGEPLWLARAQDATTSIDVSELFTPGRRPAEIERFLGRLDDRGTAVAELALGQRRLELEGAAIGASLVIRVRDVSEERSADDELRRLRRIETVGLATACLVHDFNNLLTPVLCLSGHLARVAEGTPSAAVAAEIESCAERAAALARDLLALAKEETSAPCAVDPAEVVLEMRPLIERLAGERVEVTIRGERGRGRVLVDRGELERVVLNLVCNSRDAMPSGGRLSIAVAPAETEGGPGARLSVSDDGVGMSAEVRARAFEPFFTTRPSGSGLGLASVRRFAHEHRGRVDLASRPGAGTSVTLFLPYAAREPAEVSVAEAARTILVVDRSDEVRRAAAVVLEQAGYRVLSAGSVDDAVAAAVGSEAQIDLAVVEEALGHTEGRALLELLRAARHRAAIVWTRSGREGAIEARPERLLQKAFTAQDLIDVVRASLAADPR